MANFKLDMGICRLSKPPSSACISGAPQYKRLLQQHSVHFDMIPFEFCFFLKLESYQLISISMFVFASIIIYIYI